MRFWKRTAMVLGIWGLVAGIVYQTWDVSFVGKLFLWIGPAFLAIESSEIYLLVNGVSEQHPLYEQFIMKERKFTALCWVGLAAAGVIMEVL